MEIGDGAVLGVTGHVDHLRGERTGREPRRPDSPCPPFNLRPPPLPGENPGVLTLQSCSQKEGGTSSRGRWVFRVRGGGIAAASSNPEPDGGTGEWGLDPKTRAPPRPLPCPLSHQMGGGGASRAPGRGCAGKWGHGSTSGGPRPAGSCPRSPESTWCLAEMRDLSPAGAPHSRPTVASPHWAGKWTWEWNPGVLVCLAPERLIVIVPSRRPLAERPGRIVPSYREGTRGTETQRMLLFQGLFQGRQQKLGSSGPGPEPTNTHPEPLKNWLRELAAVVGCYPAPAGMAAMGRWGEVGGIVGKFRAGGMGNSSALSRGQGSLVY